jgi:F-type H+-transporting ATPase subunit a
VILGFLTQSVATVADSVRASADTVVAAVAKAAEPSNGSWIIDHVADSRTLEFLPFGEVHLPHIGPFNILGMSVDMSLTKHVVMLWAAGVLLIVAMRAAAKGYKKSLVPGRFASVVEILVLFVRDDIVVPAMGERGKKFLPYFLTLFFFILFSNLFGLLPYASTPTGNINVTAALAIIAFFVIQIAGIVRYGLFGYFKGLVPPGIPTFVLPVMVVVEILGLLTKPFALCVRLFANMIAGHIVIFSLIGLIFIFGTVLIAPISVAFALFIEVLELLIATIQAYIFTILTALFVGMAIHQEH